MFFLGANGACSLIIGDLEPPGIVNCTTGCGTAFTAGFGGAGGDAATGGGGIGGSVVQGGGGTGGDAGTGATGGTTATGGSGAGGGCDADHKSCDDDCVLIDDPTFGCGPSDCEPCVVVNATAACVDGACAVDTCDDGYMDCDEDVGCEADILTDPLHCGGCDPCGEYVDQPCQAGKCNPGCGAGNVPISTEGYALCLTVLPSDHTPGNSLGLGGEYTNSADELVNGFPFEGCEAPDPADHQVACSLDIKAGTNLKVRDGYYAPYFESLCDPTATNPATCRGTLTLYLDGVVQAAGTYPLDGSDGFTDCVVDPPGYHAFGLLPVPL
ncbi:MAG: hypothetical protein V1745_00425 [Patescibacteria group bacterium]